MLGIEGETGREVKRLRLLLLFVRAFSAASALLRSSSSIRVCCSRSSRAFSCWNCVFCVVSAVSAVVRRVRRVVMVSLCVERSDSRSLALEVAESRSDSRSRVLEF